MDPTTSHIRKLNLDDVDDMLKDMPDHPTITQVAAMLNVNGETVRRMLKAGTMPGHPLPSNRWVLRKPAIRKWLLSLHDHTGDTHA